MRRGGGSADAPELQDAKLWAIDFAIERTSARSIADLGGVWAVGAGYTFHALNHHSLDRAVLVDTGITDEVRARSAHHPQLRLVDADLGDSTTVDNVGAVDVVLLFDVLLHQVDPDWDEVIRRWSHVTDTFVIVQPQYNQGNRSIRLVDLGEADYLRLVPDEENARLLFSRLDEIHPMYQRPWRDVHEVWQWGITDADLQDCLRAAGYRRLAYVNHGQWFELDGFDYCVFVYQRRA